MDIFCNTTQIFVFLFFTTRELVINMSFMLTSYTETVHYSREATKICYDNRIIHCTRPNNLLLVTTISNTLAFYLMLLGALRLCPLVCIQVCKFRYIAAPHRHVWSGCAPHWGPFSGLHSWAQLPFCLCCLCSRFHNLFPYIFCGNYYLTRQHIQLSLFIVLLMFCFCTGACFCI